MIELIKVYRGKVVGPKLGWKRTLWPKSKRNKVQEAS